MHIWHNDITNKFHWLASCATSPSPVSHELLIHNGIGQVEYEIVRAETQQPPYISPTPQQTQHSHQQQLPTQQ